MENLKIIYIDDYPETSLSKYLDKYKNSSCNVESLDIKFNPDAGYESLINNPDVKSANIIFIDSKLFENRTAIAGKFTGEEFKIILKKYFPFIEVIVITQNEIAPDYETISKYDPKCGKTPVEYYDEKLPPILDQCIRNIFEVRKITSELQKNTSWENEIAPDYETISKYDPKCGKTPVEYYDEKLPPILDQCIRNIFEVRKITSELQKNTSWEKVMVEKIVNSVNGQGKFDEFTKNDIDDVIKMFQELQTKVEG